MELADLQAASRFVVRQRLAMMVNRYVVSLADGSWQAGPTVAFAQQKRMTMKEQVTIWTDESGSAELCRFRARQVIDLAATYDVTAPDGAPIGSFRRDFAQSLLRSTWHLEQPDRPAAIGRERNLAVALVRRVVDVPLLFHFDFVSEGRPVMSVDKKLGLRDTYLVEIHVEGLDRRLALAQAIALDALQSR